MCWLARATVVPSPLDTTTPNADAAVAMAPAHRRHDALDITLAHCVRIKSLLSTSDGKDKVLSLMQYACMTVSGGADGDALRAQKSLASARKPFRVFKVRVCVCDARAVWWRRTGARWR